MNITENEVVIKMKKDYIFRTFIISTFSFVITLGFTIYNVYLALTYKYI